MAGANSIFTSNKRLTTGNCGGADAALFGKLELTPKRADEPMRAAAG